MNTADILDRLRRRHSSAKGEWATIREFDRVDFLAVACYASRHWQVHGYEIKTSRSDWLRELAAGPNKSHDGRQIVDYWWVAAPKNVVHASEVPDDWGWLVVHDAVCRVAKRAPALRPPIIPDDIIADKPEFHNRRAFAALARRYSYAQADADALASHANNNERVAALDDAAVATGRLLPSQAEQRLARQREWNQHVRDVREQHRESLRTVAEQANR